MIARSVMFNAMLGLGLIFVAGQVSAADIRIDNQDAGTGQGLDDPTPASPVGLNPGTTRGQQAQIVFQFAADLWGAVLQSDVPVKVSASFAKLSCTATSGVLGSAGTTGIFAFDDPAPAGALVTTWYHSALVDALSGEDANEGVADIRARFNGALGSTGCLEGANWYFGLDGNQPAGSINFLNVVLHEMSHGLGFSGFGSLTTGKPLAGNDGIGRPDIYSTFVYDNTQNSGWYAMTDSQRIASAMNDGGLVFTGANVKNEAAAALSPRTALHISAPSAAVGDYAFNQADFGPVATPSNFTGEIIAAVTGGNSEGCAAFDNAAAVNGHIALVTRGTCAFTDKVGYAQAAGATAVLIANNKAGIIIPSGTPTGPVTIPMIAVSQVDGDTLKANLGGLTGDVVMLGGFAGSDTQGNVQLYAPTTLAQGSSFSHYDTRLTPNALMEFAINSDLQGQFTLDLTPALFKDEGWGTNTGSQSLLGCNTGIPTLLPGGIVIGANVFASANVMADAAPTVEDYRTAIRAYAASLAADLLIDSGQTSSLNACLSDPETLTQWNAWSASAPPPAQALSVGVAVTGQSGAALSSKVYTLEVPAGAMALSLRTFGGSGDVTVYVKKDAEASPTDFTWKSKHARTNNESVMIGRPAAGTYYITVYGESAFSGVTVLGKYTQR